MPAGHNAAGSPSCRAHPERPAKTRSTDASQGNTDRSRAGPDCRGKPARQRLQRAWLFAGRSPPPSPTVTPSTTASTRVQLDWATLITQARGSVVRFQVRTCDEQGTGSGFLVGDRLVMTAAHVVDQAVSISLATDSAVTTAQVIAIDRRNDSALVRRMPPFRLPRRACPRSSRPKAPTLPCWGTRWGRTNCA